MNGVLGHFVNCAFEGMMQTEHKLYISQTERKRVVSERFVMMKQNH